MSRSVTINQTCGTNGVLLKTLARPAPLEALPNIFEYQDYRKFLREVIGARRKNRGGYSIADFAKALGFSSHAGLAMVLNGQRELRSPYVEACIRSLKLSLRQQLYFEAMIRADRLSAAKRRALLQEIDSHSATWEPPATQDGIRLIDFFLVQQILSLCRGYVSIDKIISQFRYGVEKKTIQGALDWMIDKKYAERSPQGYRINKSILMVQDEKPNASGKQFHKDCMTLAHSALDTDALENREFQTYLVTVDSRKIPEMKKWIKKLVLEAIAEFETELDGDTVVQMHFNLFEASNRMGAGQRDQLMESEASL
ncbi:MAG TPA: hypothetical protein DCS07_03835 [Bdellovibrionales bacterium]|nr:MAG: hypothetical protein A2Z97_02665 [Bdellovibrionales bacterium GWB1_52_6]OFZ03476.1 MAG: hypothetical protein A2X97_05890 [Bdellovibrionales bacterium GWA1_52_35]OFZ41362.1 MAG: hypothetical protein A2070_05230 [Bdellovibrionales bacterium GWC1_52_8]HAR41749.1 hypothetical protein [Bdellovibrionales bacterium]HCM41060.1 hypothetical protein [Bdellovibrionales bacterium]